MTASSRSCGPRDPVDHAIVVSSDGGRSWQPIELPIQLPQFGEPGLSPEGDAVVMSLELRRFITEDGGGEHGGSWSRSR